MSVEAACRWRFRLYLCVTNCVAVLEQRADSRRRSLAAGL